MGLFETRQEGEGKEDPQVIQALPAHWITHVHCVLNLAEAELRQEQRKAGDTSYTSIHDTQRRGISRAWSR